MSRWKSKACPRCGGDMFIDRDLDSWYEQCLQCSYKVELKPLVAARPRIADEGKETGKKEVISGI